MRKKIFVTLGVPALIVATYFISLALANNYVDKNISDDASGTQKEEIQPYKVETNIELNATQVCLKHTDQTGPQTEECALGLKDEDTGKFYFIKNPEKIEGLPKDQVVQIKGILTENDDTKYIQEGTVEIVSLSIHYDLPDNWSI